jgi:hypothetical protein
MSDNVFMPDNLISGDFPRISKLVWFEEKCYRGAVVCSKLIDGDKATYTMLDGTMLGKIISKVSNFGLTNREGIVERLLERLDEQLDSLYLKIRYPFGILAEDVHPEEGGKKQAAVWLTGCFNPDAIKFGEGISKHALEEILRDSSIFMKEVW